MKTSSMKAKGRRCGSEAKDLILKHFKLFQDADIVVTPSGVTGKDLLLSPLVQRYLPLAIECKNQEKLAIWSALEQAESHSDNPKDIPTLLFKRNRSELYVAMKFEDFLKLRLADYPNEN